ncbi:MAG: hypothetical protein ACD_62C00260G0002 [uncultured bacterium]|nr:MAG: hypothetical protein ACD_62C00260G0002 [uncultured bacterium]HLD44014.1 TIGR02147 family protein [bacterium]
MGFNHDLSTNVAEKAITVDAVLKNIDKLNSCKKTCPLIHEVSLASLFEHDIMECSMTVFDFTDYREFLRAYYEEQKKKYPFFSYRYFARLADIGGQSYLQMIMSGKRNLSAKTVQKFIKAIKLKKKDAQYFETLVLFNQTKKEDERELYLDRLLCLKPAKKISQLQQDRYLYFTNKNLVILREMVSLPHFEEDPEWISRSLNGAITPKEVVRIIELLIKLDLIKRNDEGKLVLSSGSVKTPQDVESLEAYQYYRSIFNDAKEAILTVPFDKREVDSLTIPISDKHIPKIKEIIQTSLEEIVKLVNSEKEPFDDVYQINTIFYPVTKTGKKEGV